jgi:MFS family permease
LTSTLGWQWIFLLNLPVGAAVFLIGLSSLPRDTGQTAHGRLDVAGAVTLTTALLLALYAIVHPGESAGLCVQTLTLLSISAALLTLFLGIEARATAPLVPYHLFRTRNLLVAATAQLLFSAALSTWWFICSNYLQLVRGYDALHVGLAFLPASQTAAVFALGLSSRAIGRFGIKLPLILGYLIAAVGLTLFALTPVSGDFVLDVLPGMILVGLGAGMCSAPAVLAAIQGVNAREFGVASGVYGTVIMMGSTLGLAVLATCADNRSRHLLANGVSHPEALNSGYHLAFFSGAVLIAISVGLNAMLLKSAETHRIPHN